MTQVKCTSNWSRELSFTVTMQIVGRCSSLTVHLESHQHQCVFDFYWHCHFIGSDSLWADRNDGEDMSAYEHHKDDRQYVKLKKWRIKWLNIHSYITKIFTKSRPCNNQIRKKNAKRLNWITLKRDSRCFW